MFNFNFNLVIFQIVNEAKENELLKKSLQYDKLKVKENNNDNKAHSEKAKKIDFMQFTK